MKSVEGSSLQVDGSAAPPKVNGADIIQVDVKATNGIIHVIDKVLIPPDVSLPTAGVAGADARRAAGLKLGAAAFKRWRAPASPAT